MIRKCTSRRKATTGIWHEGARRRGRGIGPCAHGHRHGRNVADVTQAHVLLHGDETAALGDAGYEGVEQRPENLGKSVTWYVAMKRSKRKALPKNKLGRLTESWNI